MQLWHMDVMQVSEHKRHNTPSASRFGGSLTTTETRCR